MAGGVIAVVLVLVGATGFGAWWRWRSGRMLTSQARQDGGLRLTEAQLGTPLGSQATLLQFSSEFCAPCRATRAVLAEIAAGQRGVAHVEVDVDDRLDLVRLLDVRRTPAVFVLGADGAIARQATGQPRRAAVIEAVAQARDAAPGGRG